jgi:hypothetical protein
VRAQGGDPAQRAAELDALVPKIEQRLLSERRTLGEIDALVEEALKAP